MLRAEHDRRPSDQTAEHRLRTLVRELREMALRIRILRDEETAAGRMLLDRIDRPAASLVPLQGKLNRLAIERRQLARQFDAHLSEFRSLALGDPRVSPLRRDPGSPGPSPR